MLDRTIPFYNTIMKCSEYSPGRAELLDGFSIVPYRRGYEKEWARLECAIGDFGSLDEAEKYFIQTYLQDPKQFGNILFLLNGEREVVGSCIAWRDSRGKRSVSSLHWLVVREKYQGMGLGRALCTAVMNIYAERGALPVYIHTQPWSWKAVLLYLSLGFRLQKTDTFSRYENEYAKALAELRKFVSGERYEMLLRSAED
ncbi:MAG: GNAT family N-acetyltransferase [Clostridiales bacterium]|nr:GNAT family N-acetyltransferase [Clostridiales bacterium]